MRNRTAMLCALLAIFPLAAAEPSWLESGYHLAGPPTSVPMPPADPILGQLQELQNQTLTILRKADFAGDLQTALDAIAQAQRTAEIMALVTGRLTPPQAPARPALYLIALKDQSIHAAAAYWVEGKTLHYLTRDGKQEEAPLDTVDRELTLRLNHERGVEIQLPPNAPPPAPQ